MVRNIIAVGLVAAVGLVEAAPALEPFPMHAAADSICTATYKAWLPLSSLAAATTYCNIAFPLSTPVCTTTTITSTTTTGSIVSTQTYTEVDATETTVTTGTPIHTATTTATASQQVTNTTTTYTLHMTEAVCPDHTGAAIPFGPPSTVHSSSTTSAVPAGKFVEYLKKKLHHPTGHAKVKAAAAAKTTANPLSAALTSLEALKTKGAAASASASTICACIRSNPACTTSTHTAWSTSKSVVWSTKTVVANPIFTKNVKNQGTATVTSYVFPQPTINYFTEFVTSASYVSQCSGFSMQNGPPPQTTASK
ncbi:hypothetical protein ANO11243_051240 [Dothideomycetidae sp. 11243]|nr:hypothetical protein ANO11243_051240 [fungal sp. No.11243]